MMRPSPVRAWFLALMLCVATVLLCISFVDRPVANYVHQRFYATTAYAWAAHLLQPFRGGMAALGLFALGAGTWALAGRSLPRWAQATALAAAGALMAVVVAVALKRLIGRSDVDPTYLVRGLYGFHPLHGGFGYDAFPSATMAGTTAVLAVFWCRYPQVRPWCGVLVALVVTAVLITNGHWVADVVGGGFLGGTVGGLVSPMGRTRGARAEQYQVERPGTSLKK